MSKAIKIIFCISFVSYLFALAALLFLTSRPGTWSLNSSVLETIRFNSNFVPFKTIGTYIRAIFNNSMNHNIPIRNLFGNLLMFLPMGIYLPFFSSKVNKTKIFTSLMMLILLSVETIQLITSRGSFDIDDIILNMAGALIGLCVWKTQLIQKLFTNYREKVA